MISKVLTFLLILYLCYRLFKFLFRPLLVILAKRAVKKGFGKQENHWQQKKAPEGSIHINHVPPKEKQTAEFRGGEYVDYEEVDK